MLNGVFHRNPQNPPKTTWPKCPLLGHMVFLRKTLFPSKRDVYT
jgi:hypothetical protein